MENLNNNDKELIRLKNLAPKKICIFEDIKESEKMIDINLLKKLCGNDTVQAPSMNIKKIDISNDGIGCFVHDGFFSS